MRIKIKKVKKKNIIKKKRVVSNCQDCSYETDDGKRAESEAKTHARKEKHLMHIWTEIVMIYDYTP